MYSVLDRHIFALSIQVNGFSDVFFSNWNHFFFLNFHFFLSESARPERSSAWFHARPSGVTSFFFRLSTAPDRRATETNRIEMNWIGSQLDWWLSMANQRTGNPAGHPYGGSNGSRWLRNEIITRPKGIPSAALPIPASAATDDQLLNIDQLTGSTASVSHRSGPETTT